MGLEGYEIKDILAQSQTTVVRRAIRRSDGAPVVIKTLSREYPTARELGQLEFEYRILRKLEAPGILRALDLQRDHDRPSLILEDYGGQSLVGRGAAGLPLDLFFEIAIAVARALGYVHGRDVIHKDVTPSNILMNWATHEVKLIDFGISSELSQEHQGGDPATHLEGTLPYISPEQTGRMNRDLDYRSDYYTLGATLFELLTGSLPFSATDMMGWVHCHISKPAPSARDRNPALPETVSRLLCKLLAKNPDDRYQSSHGLIQDLERCRGEWAQHGAIADFVLGAHDVPERFQVSQTLFGREREAEALLGAFEDASGGSAKLLLVGGYSGVGKSALIHELQKDIVRKRGHFISGKFDQLERNVPYRAVLQALRGLVKQLLGEPEDQLQSWKQRLSAAVGSNAKVLIDLIPELEQILGPPAAIPELHPREAQARFQRVFRDFVGAVAQPEHPLVLFVDDLQWADASTPELLTYLLSDAGLCHLLVIGAYRDNEVHEGHPVLVALKEIREQRPDALREIALLPLSEASVNRIIADTLRCDSKASQPLAELISQKTGGNPFFVKELLGMLARDGSFRFVAEHGRWDWDYDKISRAGVSDNVVDLMVQRLRRLPTETIEVLRLAACVGNQFDLETIARVAERRPGQVGGALWAAVQARVLVPLGSSYRLVHDDHDYNPSGHDTLAVQYRFQHDRVQQAAYSLLDRSERAQIHLKIGRLLLGSSKQVDRDENVFELVNHLNLGRELITTFDERSELARLNEVAGVRARRAAAYVIAAAYFETSADLLSPTEWATQPKRYFDSKRNHAECIFFSGEPDRAASLCDPLVETAPDKWCRIAALELKARILDQQARLMEAIGTLRTGLGLVGLVLPEDPAEIERQIGEGIGKMQGHLARTRIEDFVHLPEMVDEEKIVTMNLLFQLVIPAIQAYPPLFVLAELLMFDLALTFGTTGVSCKNFVDCGIIQGPIIGDYDGAYRLGKVAFEFLKRDASKPLASAVSFVFASFVSPWRANYRESLRCFADAERLGLELGDVQHTSYAHTLGTMRWFFVGKPLDECHAKAEFAATQLRQMRATNQLDGVVLVQRVVARLRGSESDARALRDSEEAYTERLQKSGNSQWLFQLGHSQLMASLILGDFTAAEKWDAFATQYTVSGGNIQFSLPDQYLFDSLVLTRKYGAASEPERAIILEKLAVNEAKLKTWAESCPENFAHKHKLACAEIARVKSAPMETVVTLYKDAISAAADDFVHLRALANELLAEYWNSRGQAKIARLFVQEAYYLYQRWGASAKLRQLEQRHPRAFESQGAAGQSLLTTITTDTALRSGVVRTGSLDLESMIKATHAISSEVKPDRLYAKLMVTIIENAGAQRGCLILKSESTGQLYVEATAQVDGEAREASKAIRIEDCTELCADIVRYVARTSSAVVLDNALGDEAYQDDEYIQHNAVKSLLCMPVLNQGKLIAILYAENNATTRAFTSERLQLLRVIAGQAAISITNARLYDSLEEKVAERTRELTEKNREVAAMLHSMHQGIFTVDESLTVQPQYSAHLEQILGESAIAGRDCVQLLFEGSNVSGAALSAMHSALQFSFGSAAFLAIVNWGHLVKAFQRTNRRGEAQFFEVDWNPITGETDEVHKILVAVRDVTELKRLHETAARNARELDVVGQVLDAGPSSFKRFADSTRTLMQELRIMVVADVAPTRDTLEVSFRNTHTVKGNARMLGLTHLVDTIHAAEEAYVALRADPRLAPDAQKLIAGADAVLSQLGEYEDICQRKLGDVAREQDARQADTLSGISGILEEAGGGSLSPAEALAGIERALKRAAAVPLRDVVKDVGRMLPSLAKELAKPSPLVDCADAGIELTPEWSQIMRDVLIHAFTNSLDHGIEDTAERRAKGKAAQGRIVVRGSRVGDRIVLRVSDDGAGLRLEALRDKARELSGTDEEVANRVFLSGISTATQTSAISGRGVGLDAVRSFVRGHGGDARIVFTAGGRDGCRPFELVLDLPGNAAVLAVGAPPRPAAEATSGFAAH